jgi:asparagine synthase (glutamine-hydrolysing)
MCGIVGFSGEKQTSQTERLLEFITHRGRDERVTWFGKGMNLGMNRLAINDLRTGLYPVSYKQYVMVFNGEIYNARELQQALAHKGVRVEGRCDAEVILPLFDLYGRNGFKKLEGMFAISIFDMNTEELWLVRDRLGEKPMYYAKTKMGLLFASELKVLLQSGLIEKRLNTEALPDYLHHGSIAGKETLIKDVYKLLPGTVMRYGLTDRQQQLYRYYSLPPTRMELPQRFEDKMEILDNLLQEVVSARLLADVEVGAFLSGGVDSSLVAAMAAKKVSRLKTYSVAFPGSRIYNEAPYARRVARFIGSDHTEIDCTAKTTRPVIERIGELIDEPIMDPAVLPTLLLSQAAAKQVKVVVTGEGADEVFAGYYRFHKYFALIKAQQMVSLVPGLMKLASKVVPGRWKHYLEPAWTQYNSLHTWEWSELQQLLKTPVVASRVGETFDGLVEQQPLLAMQLTDMRGYMGAQILSKLDRFTMLSTLEARAPFLDSQLVQLALSLPEIDRLRGVEGKYILKKVAEKYLPKNIVWRLKHGFSLPLGTWFRHQYSDLVYEAIDVLKRYEKVFNVSVYEKVVEQHMMKNGENDYRDKIWSMTVLALWLKHYKITL